MLVVLQTTVLLKASVQVPYKGPVEATINEILGGVRFTCSTRGSIFEKSIKTNIYTLHVTIESQMDSQKMLKSKVGHGIKDN